MSPTFWQSLDAALSEVRRLALEQPGQPRFEVVEVSEVLATQVVLEGAEEVEGAKSGEYGGWGTVV
jgi:hypothetical protein